MEEQRENKTTPIQSPQLSGFTLQQVIAIIDSRLANLEKLSVTSDDESKEQYIDEFETRFEILAEDFSSLKQTVLSLQSYTMSVNKILMDDKLNKSIDL